MAKRLTAKVGEYEKDGQTKGKYVDLGVILSSDKGEYMLVDPTVNLGAVLTLQNMLNHKAGRKTSDRVMVGIYADDQSGRSGGGGSGGSAGSAAGGGGAVDDEIPF